MESRSKGGRHSPLSPAGCSIIPHFLDRITQTLCVDTRVCVCVCMCVFDCNWACVYCALPHPSHQVSVHFWLLLLTSLPRHLGSVEVFFFNNYLFFLLGKCFIHALTALGLENFIEEGHKEEMKVKTR